MRKNITIGFSPSEYLRLQGAAAVTDMPVSTYLKWLIRGAPSADSSANHLASTVLRRLEEISIAIAKLPRPEPAMVPVHYAANPSVSAEVIEAKLRDRGIPSSTIRQLRIVLEELGIMR